MGGNMSKAATLGIRTLDKTATTIGIKTDTTSAPNSAKTNPPLRLFAKPEEEDIATWRPPASSVWIVETADRKTGPNCVFHQAYRLRHFATGIYFY